MSITAKTVTRGAKNVVYAAVGATDAAVKSAKSLTGRVGALPKTAKNVTGRIATLPKSAKSVGAIATEMLRDAARRFDRYVARGRSVVGRNGSPNGSKPKPKSVRSAKPKPDTTVTPAAPTPAAPAIVEARSAETAADVVG